MAAAVTMRVGDVAVVLAVIHAGDGDRLRHVPVGRGEDEAGRRTVPSVVSELLSAMVTLAVGWRVQHHGEGGRRRRPRWSPGRRSASR